MSGQTCLKEYAVGYNPKQAPKKVRSIQTSRRFKFRPRSIWPFLTWGLTIFLACKILLIPLTEGVYNLVVKSREVNQLKIKQQHMAAQLDRLIKARDYMKTMTYVEERSHQAGFIKNGEAPMVVVDAPLESITAANGPRKRIEIGD